MAQYDVTVYWAFPNMSQNGQGVVGSAVYKTQEFPSFSEGLSLTVLQQVGGQPQQQTLIIPWHRIGLVKVVETAP